jgi:chloramphenicol 3-O phosphotransferase
MPDSGRRGQIIFLNGTSSSGKSGIAEELRLLLDPPHFHMSVEAFNSMRARQKTLELDPAELDAVLARTRAGFHRAVAGMAEAGNDLVVDHVLSEQWRLLDCLAVRTGYRVAFVGVHCSTAASARDCALRIKAFLDRGQEPAAFAELGSRLLGGGSSGTI